MDPTTEVWKALNIDRITHLYSCDTLLKCLTRLDNHRGTSELNLRTRLQHGVEVIQQILNLLTYGEQFTVKTTENQIDVLKQVEAELAEVWKTTEPTSFDQVELTIADGLLKGISSFMTRLRHQMITQPPDVAPQGAQA